MIIVKLIGGMGNQMFQYAFARQMMEQYKEECYLDLTWYEKTRKSHEKFMLNKFLINNEIKLISSKDELKKIVPLSSRFALIRFEIKHSFIYHILGREQAVKYGIKANKQINKKGIYSYLFWFDYFKLVLRDSRFKYLLGYWQSEKFFYDVRNIVKVEFEQVENCFRHNFTNKILETESVAIHIRRGDYLEDEQMQVCSQEYYKNAIKYMKKRLNMPHFFVFSNEISWIRENMQFRDIPNITYVDVAKSDFEDFCYMKQCKHFIMSNSTFCWWAQFLSNYADKIVIAPQKWTTNEIINDIYQEEWIRI